MSEEQTRDFQTFERLLKEYLARQDKQVKSELDQFSQEELYTKYQTYHLQLSSESLMNPEAVFLDWLDSRKYRQHAQPEPDKSTQEPQIGADPPEPAQQASSSPDQEKGSPGSQHQQEGSDEQSDQEQRAQQGQSPAGIEANARQAIDEFGLSAQQIDVLVHQATQELDLDVGQVIQGTPAAPKDQSHADQSESLGR